MGDKHPLGLIEGATENAATVQALIDNLVVPQRSSGQVHKARNILERLPKSLHALVRRVLRQAWELDDADKAEKLIPNLARRLERDWSGVSGSILEGIEETPPLRGLDCHRNCAVRLPAQTLSRMSGARCAACAET